ncbi:unnamed protein product [Symbiodinium sp. CCMP2592]|nr:unnamed protein product [Symbiodinium sp. CCMP2592]
MSSRAFDKSGRILLSAKTVINGDACKQQASFGARVQASASDHGRRLVLGVLTSAATTVRSKTNPGKRHSDPEADSTDLTVFSAAARLARPMRSMLQFMTSGWRKDGLPMCRNVKAKWQSHELHTGSQVACGFSERCESITPTRAVCQSRRRRVWSVTLERRSGPRTQRRRVSAIWKVGLRVIGINRNF